MKDFPDLQVASLAGLLCLSQAANGQTNYNWTSSPGGNKNQWGANTNWTPTAVPTSVDTAIFSGPTAPEGITNVTFQTTSYSVGTLQLNQQWALTLSGGTGGALNAATVNSNHGTGGSTSVTAPLTATTLNSSAGSLAVSSLTATTINSSGGSLAITALGGTGTNISISGGGVTLTNAATVNNLAVTLPSGTALTATNGINVNGVLSGGATIAGNTTVGSAGRHQVGGSGTVGAQTFTNTLTYSSGSVFDWDVTTAGAFDQVVATSASGGTAIFNIVTAISDPFWNIDRTFTSVFSATNLASLFSSFRLNGAALTGGVVAGQGTFSFSGSNVEWTPSLIPEPTTALAGLLLSAGLLRRRRPVIAC